MSIYFCPQCKALLSNDGNIAYCPDCNKRWKYIYRVEELDLLACHVTMTEEERKEYEDVYSTMQLAFDAFVAESGLRPQYAYLSNDFRERWRKIPKRDDNDGNNYFKGILLKGFHSDHYEDVTFYRHPDEEDDSEAGDDELPKQRRLTE